MSLNVYRTTAGYLLLDDGMALPQPGTELVFSIPSSRVPESVAALLERAMDENGPLELRESWADHFFHDCADWGLHKRRAESVPIG